MANVSLPRPDLEAHRNSLMLTMPELLRALISTIGKKLTASSCGEARVLRVSRSVRAQVLSSAIIASSVQTEVTEIRTAADEPGLIEDEYHEDVDSHLSGTDHADERCSAASWCWTGRQN
jgi:hypothetical protein